ncbi:hypothetical protein AN478_11850 [Thiohalorhabdus denitrificans]|nr:hypothetical protein AN478_11850 [Thiohalorhabdus denitrificans]
MGDPFPLQQPQPLPGKLPDVLHHPAPPPSTPGNRLQEQPPAPLQGLPKVRRPLGGDEGAVGEQPHEPAGVAVQAEIPQKQVEGELVAQKLLHESGVDGRKAQLHLPVAQEAVAGVGVEGVHAPALGQEPPGEHVHPRGH